MAQEECHKPGPELIFHTDRGSQYCGNNFQKALKRNKMLNNMNRKGACCDDAVAESFFTCLSKLSVLLGHIKYFRKGE
jgi:transposase InsO family protein